MYILYHHSLYKGVYTIVYMETKKQPKTRIRFNAKFDVNKVLNNLNESMKIIEENMKTLNIPEEILDREIKPFGNASHIILPKEYSNKQAKIIIKK